MLGLKELEGLSSFNINGYVSYYIPDHHLSNKSGIVYEHMLAAEKMLGRELNEGEVVHHKDGNRSNNSFDNLIVFKSASDHAAFHRGRCIHIDNDVYVADEIDIKSICPLCGNAKDNKADTCIDCYNIIRASNIPTKETLYDLLRKYNMCEIGRMFGVSDNAVRNWCKKYGLPYKSSDLKQLRINK